MPEQIFSHQANAEAYPVNIRPRLRQAKPSERSSDDWRLTGLAVEDGTISSSEAGLKGLSVFAKLLPYFDPVCCVGHFVLANPLVFCAHLRRIYSLVLNIKF